MGMELSTDTAAAARHARFGKLPERVRIEDTVEGAKATPGGGKNAYDPEGSWKYYSCLALDLGL
ncbi:hypothetical protein BJ965_000189 [Streptomyces luteogriseus]|uniref:Uncharacterized protein n=1 Tax=Streptomyces luteogriseus TaxID=68233 RepID=A0A7W7DJ87_9ACTN|nr:hypothetical protein [Streptomyces luteogriseus]MBB4710307.1 hypothetical protein [Streptomyces luteogriseus]